MCALYSMTDVCMSSLLEQNSARQLNVLLCDSKPFPGHSVFFKFFLFFIIFLFYFFTRVSRHIQPVPLACNSK